MEGVRLCERVLFLCERLIRNPPRGQASFACRSTLRRPSADASASPSSLHVTSDGWNIVLLGNLPSRTRAVRGHSHQQGHRDAGRLNSRVGIKETNSLQGLFFLLHFNGATGQGKMGVDVRRRSNHCGWTRRVHFNGRLEVRLALISPRAAWWIAVSRSRESDRPNRAGKFALPLRVQPLVNISGFRRTCSHLRSHFKRTHKILP
jgi:hypothetical protein